MAKRKTESTIDIDQLTPDQANVRRRTDRSSEVIANSLKQFGAGRSILLDKNGVVRAGNGTVEGAKKAGIQKVRVIETDGTELIAVKRTDLSGSDATAYAIADNRSSDLSSWEFGDLEEQITALGEEGFDFDELGFSEEELKFLLDSACPIDGIAEESEPEDVEPQIDRAEELKGEWGTAAGQLWIIEGKQTHRLLCGDSTKREDVGRLMDGQKINVGFTSPPYASQRTYDESSGFKPIHPDEFSDWFEPIQENVQRNLADDGSWFVNIKPACEGLSRLTYVFDLVLNHIRNWGWNFAEEFCWERTGIPQQVVRRFKNQFEPVYQFTKGDWKFRPDAVRHQSSSVPLAMGKGAGDTNAAKRQGVLSAVDGNEVSSGMAYPGNRLPKFQSEALGHAAAFPVGLPSFFIKAFSDEGDNVYEPFTGSGTTMLAAEQLNRKCYGIEISPKYCAIILQRMKDAGCECRLSE